MLEMSGGAMQAVRFVSVLLFLANAEGVSSNPLAEVISLLNDLQAKITKEGEAELKAFNEYAAWCHDYSRNTQNEIKAATAQRGRLEAQLAELGANIEVADAKIGDLAASISSGGKELQDATEIRTKEAADFVAAERELVEATDVLDRAIAVLHREMNKNPAALMQIDTSNMAKLMQSLSTVIDAAAFSTADRQTLSALVQSRQEADSDEGDLGAPAAAVYKTHSTNIFDVLQDMQEKAMTQLSKLRRAEVNARHNFNMLKQSLEDQIAADNRELSDTKTAKASAKESQAVATGDLGGTMKDLKALQGALAAGDQTCKQFASDHEATVAARSAELKVIGDALHILTSTTSGAEGQTYSLLQVKVKSNLRSHGDLVKSEVLVLVKRLAKEHHSAALAQLASRVAAVMRSGDSQDVFAKVKRLIKDLIDKLEAEANSDSQEKAFCDEELANTKAKKEELDDDVAKLTTKLDQAVARSAQLKADVKDLQAELAALAKSQLEMNQMRADTHADFVQAKADLEKGLNGVRRAIEILRDYYAKDTATMVEVGSIMQQPARPEMHTAAVGAGNSIIGILEVVESDFASDLAKEEIQEDDAQASHEKVTQENAITKTVKDQSIKYKTSEFKTLDKNINELSTDRRTTNTELDAVLEYYSQLKARCIAKPETYETRRDRRAAEIEGLKRALEILQNEVAFMQRKHRGVRGVLSP